MAWSGQEQSRVVVCRRGPLLAVRWYADGTEWRDILDNFKDAFPPTVRRFDGATRWWMVAGWQGPYLRAWCRENFDADSITWDGEGAASSESRENRYQRDGAGFATQEPPESLSAAYATLHLLPSAPGELVTAAYRIAASSAHPDHGGDTAAMVKVNAAMDLLRSRLRKG